MNHFSIKDIENLTGIKSHTLRIWEQRYGIPHPKRTSTNIRYYDGDDLKLLLNVSMLNRNGFKISKLTKLSKDELEKMAFERALTDLDADSQVDAMIAAMFSLDESGFDKVLSSHLVRNGLESTMIELFFPFLKRVGMLWQTGQVNPSYEHFMSNLIRQKMIVAIDSLNVPAAKNAKKFVLFLPESETHELGLLFANYIVRSRGHQSLYLGQNLAYTDLDGLMTQYAPEYLMSVVTATPPKQTTQEFVTKLGERFKKQIVILTGHQITSHSFLRFTPNTRVIHSFEDFVNFVGGI
ncbi:MAG: MerR family transcriptional regulator [Bacteroidota bacterium]